MAHAGIVEILEQLISRKVPARFDNAGKPWVVDIAVVPAAALAAKTEIDMASLNPGMPVAQGRQAKASICLGIFAVANAKEAELQKPNHRGKHPLAGQTVTTEISADPGSY